jgi:hypothetical protein
MYRYEIVCISQISWDFTTRHWTSYDENEHETNRVDNKEE